MIVGGPRLQGWWASGFDRCEGMSCRSPGQWRTTTGQPGRRKRPPDLRGAVAADSKWCLGRNRLRRLGTPESVAGRTWDSALTTSANAALLAVVAEQRPSGARLVAYFALMYYADFALGSGSISEGLTSIFLTSPR